MDDAPAVRTATASATRAIISTESAIDASCSTPHRSIATPSTYSIAR